MKLLLHDVSVPDRAPVVDKSGHLTRSWWDWFALFRLTLQSYPTRNNTISRTGLQASISATDLSIGSLAAGLYRVSYYAEITAASLGGGVTVAITWTSAGTGQTYTATQLSGTTLGHQTHDLYIHVDAATAVQYAATRASTPTYSLYLTLEHIPGAP